MAERDRISYSYGLKMNGPEKYSSIDVHLSFSTDLQDDETSEDAMERARKFIQAECEKEIDAIISSREKA